MGKLFEILGCGDSEIDRGIKHDPASCRLRNWSRSLRLRSGAGNSASTQSNQNQGRRPTRQRRDGNSKSPSTKCLQQYNFSRVYTRITKKKRRFVLVKKMHIWFDLSLPCNISRFFKINKSRSTSWHSIRTSDAILLKPQLRNTHKHTRLGDTWSRNSPGRTRAAEQTHVEKAKAGWNPTWNHTRMIKLKFPGLRIQKHLATLHADVNARLRHH
jgi:hypothetical protein